MRIKLNYWSESDSDMKFVLPDEESEMRRNV